MSDSKPTFLDLALRGEVLMEEVDDFVSAWHKSSSLLSLEAYLGMSLEEYSLWLTNPKALGYILASRKTRRSIAEIANDNIDAMRLAARAEDSGAIFRLQEWLKNRANV